MSSPTPPEVVSTSGYRVLAHQEATIATLTRQLMDQTLPQYGELGRRREPRIPYPRLVELTPLDNDQQQQAEKPFHVVGKQLASQGLDFFHHEPIPHRYVVAALEAGPERWLHFLMRINWCRFIKAGWYDSGGKFVKQIAWNSRPLARGA